MERKQKGQFVPYDMLKPGWEAIYTGETLPAEPAQGEARPADAEGNIFNRWPVWTWLGEESGWDTEVKAINKMQSQLGPLSEDIRKVRAHIGSLVPCDSSFPVTVDDLLNEIGQGRMGKPAFYNGCCHTLLWGHESRGAQWGTSKSMQTIEQVLRRYLHGEPSESLIADSPHTAGFVRRTFEWLGPRPELTEMQRLMLERMLLPFDFLTQRNPDQMAVRAECHDEGGRGSQLDGQIRVLAGLPENGEAPVDPERKKIHDLLCTLRHEFHEWLCDCHHSSFRWIEGWIHGIGTGKVHPIPTRKPGTERRRMGRLLFGYALGLDKWLLGVPMQFLLLDLGHVDLGTDPKNEILRVYAYLGEERTPVKEWLAVCLWYNLMHNCMGGLIHHSDLLERAQQAGVSVRNWMDAALAQ